MNNHLTILPNWHHFDLKCFKMRWRLTLGSLRRSPGPRIVRGIAPSAFATHYYFESSFRSQFPFRALLLLNFWIGHCFHLVLVPNMMVHLFLKYFHRFVPTHLFSGWFLVCNWLYV